MFGRTPAASAFIATLAAAALSVTLLAVPAQAQVRLIHDRAGDGSNGAGGGGARIYGDVGTVKVRYTQNAVRIRVRAAEGGKLADFYDLWFDTDAGNPGPEFAATVSLEVLPRSSVNRADRFGPYGSDGATTCRVRSARIKRQGILVVYPKRCFDSAPRLRASLHTNMEYESADWAPRPRVFGPWVKRG